MLKDLSDIYVLELLAFEGPGVFFPLLFTIDYFPVLAFVCPSSLLALSFQCLWVAILVVFESDN